MIKERFRTLVQKEELKPKNTLKNRNNTAFTHINAGKHQESIYQQSNKKQTRKSKSAGKGKKQPNATLTDRVRGTEKKDNSKNFNTLQQALDKFKMLFNSKTCQSPALSQFVEKDKQIIPSLQQKIKKEYSSPSKEKSPKKSKRKRTVQKLYADINRKLSNKQKSKSKIINVTSKIPSNLKKKSHHTKSYFQENSRRLTQHSTLVLKKKKKTKKTTNKSTIESKSKQKRKRSVTTFLSKPGEKSSQLPYKIRETTPLYSRTDRIKTIQPFSYQSIEEPSDRRVDNLSSSEDSSSKQNKPEIKFQKAGKGFLFSSDGKEYFLIDKSLSESEFSSSDYEKNEQFAFKKVKFEEKQQPLSAKNQDSDSKQKEEVKIISPSHDNFWSQPKSIQRRDQVKNQQVKNEQDKNQQSSLKQEFIPKTSEKNQFEFSPDSLMNTQKNKRRLLMMERVFKEQQDKWLQLKADLQRLRQVQDSKSGTQQSIQQLIHKVNSHHQAMKSIEVVDIKTLEKQQEQYSFISQGRRNQQRTNPFEHSSDEGGPKFVRTAQKNEQSLNSEKKKMKLNYDEAPLQVQKILKKNFWHGQSSPKGSRHSLGDFEFALQKQKSQSISRQLSQKQLLDDLQMMDYVAEELSVKKRQKNNSNLKLESEQNQARKLQLQDESSVNPALPSQSACNFQPNNVKPFQQVPQKQAANQVDNQAGQQTDNQEIKPIESIQQKANENDLTPMKVLNMLDLDSSSSQNNPSTQVLIMKIQQALITQIVIELKPRQLHAFLQIHERNSANNIQILRQEDLFQLRDEQFEQNFVEQLNGQLIKMMEQKGQTELNFDQMQRNEPQEEGINSEQNYILSLQEQILYFMMEQNQARYKDFQKRLRKPLGIRTMELVRFMRKLMRPPDEQNYDDFDEDNFEDPELQDAQYEPIISIQDICDFEQNYSQLFIRATPSATGYQQFFNQAIFDLINLLLDDFRPFGRTGLPPVCCQSQLDFKTKLLQQPEVLKHIIESTSQLLRMKLGILHFSASPEETEMQVKTSLRKFNDSCCRQIEEEWRNVLESQFEVMFELMGEIEREVVLQEATQIAGVLFTNSD